MQWVETNLLFAILLIIHTLPAKDITCVGLNHLTWYTILKCMEDTSCFQLYDEPMNLALVFDTYYNAF